MGKDFRIGLMVGLVLALGVLFWVATRPSLNPQVRIGPVSPLAQADDPVQEPGPPAGSTRPEHADRSAALDVPRPAEPKVETPNPAPDAAAQQRGLTPTRAEPMPGASPGANSSTLPDLTIYEKSEKIKTTKFHIVQRGETLSGIARLYYGAPDQWRRILAANEKTIKDPNRVAPGTKLIIPAW